MMMRAVAPAGVLLLAAAAAVAVAAVAIIGEHNELRWLVCAPHLPHRVYSLVILLVSMLIETFYVHYSNDN
jgi:hypothetical protein